MLEEVTVDGITYGRANHTDLSISEGYLVLDGEGGVVAAEESATGGLEIALYPTPTEAGNEIVVRAAWLPPDLSTSDDTTLKVPQDLTEALIAGAVGTGLRRVEHRRTSRNRTIRSSRRAWRPCAGGSLSATAGRVRAGSGGSDGNHSGDHARGASARLLGRDLAERAGGSDPGERGP